MSSWETKIWGRTRCLIESPFYSKHELEVKQGGVCSFHFHTRRANRFLVTEGEVKILWSMGRKMYGGVVSHGGWIDVASLLPHQFQVIKSGKMYEEYFSDRGGEIHNDDITRLTTGLIMPSVEYQQHSDIIFDSDGSSYF